ncbi:protein Hook homolog 2-like [Brachyistius frenatus]|uniref:protein Hook homolog 2-like n=1 Tax=Brachyistius frenatus TaxID=100188 RepID=UPI0037E856FC
MEKVRADVLEREIKSIKLQREEVSRENETLHELKILKKQLDNKTNSCLQLSTKIKAQEVDKQSLEEKCDQLTAILHEASSNKDEEPSTQPGEARAVQGDVQPQDAATSVQTGPPQNDPKQVEYLKLKVDNHKRALQRINHRLLEEQRRSQTADNNRYFDWKIICVMEKQMQKEQHTRLCYEKEVRWHKDVIQYLRHERLVEFNDMEKSKGELVSAILKEELRAEQLRTQLENIRFQQEEASRENVTHDELKELIKTLEDKNNFHIELSTTHKAQMGDNQNLTRKVEELTKQLKYSVNHQPEVVSQGSTSEDNVTETISEDSEPEEDGNHSPDLVLQESTPEDNFTTVSTPENISTPQEGSTPEEISIPAEVSGKAKVSLWRRFKKSVTPAHRRKYKHLKQKQDQ